MANVYEASPLLRWCADCCVGWARECGWHCWVCGAVAYGQRTLPFNSRYSVSTACNEMQAEAMLRDPEWEQDPCTGRTLAAVA